ncbi:MAG: hypothetical protein WC700_09095 [Gemmatimonadaceae bacterium]|jgi:hypothetical protein
MTPERRAEIEAIIEQYTKPRSIMLWDPVANIDRPSISKTGRIVPLESHAGSKTNTAEWVNGLIDAVVELLAETGDKP